MYIIDIYGEETITDKMALDELQNYQNQLGKLNIKISLCQRKIHQQKDLEEVSSRFDKVRPVVLNIEVRLP